MSIKNKKFIPLPQGVGGLLLKQKDTDKNLVLELSNGRKCVIPFPMPLKDWIMIKEALMSLKTPLTVPEKSDELLLAAGVLNWKGPGDHIPVKPVDAPKKKG